MQASTITPPRKPRRTTNQHRGQRQENSITQVPTDSEGLTEHSEDIYHRRYDSPPVMPESTSSPASATITNPMTPPRPRSMYEGTYHGQLSASVSVGDSNSKRRKNSQKQNSPRPNSSAKSRPNGTARSKSQRNVQTPGKTSATPSQAYAGPTFHASPAPSSLPIPRFFQKSLSKSVPETNKADGLAAMMDSEVSEEAPSPESSGSSPVLDKAERLQQKERDESPLDIFFRADREEKARARLSNITNHGHCNTPEVEATANVDTACATPSPVSRFSRHHSRQHTGSSAGGLFSIEMEQENPQAESPQPTPFTTIKDHHELARAHSAPSGLMTQATDEEEAKRKARSAELMRLLKMENPREAGPISPASNEIPATGSHKSPARPIREPIGPFATAPKPEKSIQILSRKQPASLPQLQKEFGCSPFSNASPRARPPSNLRQEVSGPSSPANEGLQELPASSTPSRTTKFSSNPHPNHNVSKNHIASPLQPTALSGVGSSQAQDPQLLAIADEIRRVLRLDGSGSDGVAGLDS